MSDEIHISSVVVHARPEMVGSVTEKILALDCDIAPGTDGGAQGRLVVLLERPSDRAVVQTIDALHEIPGVLSALLVYHHAEPTAALGELMT